MSMVVVDITSVLLFSVGDRDALGVYKRQLSTLAQIYSRLLNQIETTNELFNLAMDARLTGFAGFQTPAYLMLAEAIYICLGCYHLDIDLCLRRAKEAAHNIQDARFCARVTSRINAMLHHWWKISNEFDIVGTVNQLCQNPAHPEFAALHQVGEDYSERADGPNKLPLPDWLRLANTLETIAQIYQKSVVELQRFNSQQAWASDTPLPPGTWVNIPDPGFVNLLTGRLSAEILVNRVLLDGERIKLIQALVPLASANPTVLDTVLARLLLAARPTDIHMLDELSEVVNHNLGEEASAILQPKTQA